MRIAILGTRGIPASYGGFETCVEEISTRLAKRGHDVRVYCRYEDSKPKMDQYKGVKLIHLPAMRKSFISSPFNSILTTAHASLSDADVIHYFGCGNIPFTLPVRLMRRKIVLTLDGLEWKRLSYSLPARLYLRSFEELAMVFPNRTVADSKSSQRWYFERTGIQPEYIPYGATESSDVDESILNKFGLEKNGYILFAGRLVYEKGVHTLVKAYKELDSRLKLVIIGDYPGPSNYVTQLKQEADERTVFLGYVYGKDFETIRNGAMIYVHPSLLDGTSISLLGALGSGRCVVSSDLQENMDVAGDGAIYFRMEDADDLRSKLQELVSRSDIIEEMGERARKRTETVYNWERITDSYESLYMSLQN